MKKNIIIVLLLFLYQTVFASFTVNEDQKLAATCKIWGFLKYYHPNVANGNFNWDEQLFKVLPKIEKAKTDAEFSKVMENWIASLGKVKAYKTEIPNEEADYFDKNFDLSWTQNTPFFSQRLSQKLKFIEQNKIQGRQYYVEQGTEFRNEVEYSEFDDKDVNFRLLLFFRFWNYVEYFFPYKYQMDQNWDVTLAEFLPRTVNPASETDYYLSLKELSAKLNDTHALLGANKLFDFFGRHGMPFNVKIIDDKAVVTGFKNESLSKIDDIRIGDVITRIDGRAIGDLIKENQKYIEGSNYAAILNSEYPIFYGRTDICEIEFVRNGKTAAKRIKRYLYKDLNINYENNSEKYRLLENNIGYVNMAVLTADDVSAVMERLKLAKAIIFDIRNYPQGTNFTIAEYLNPEPKDFVKSIDADLSSPGRYIWRKQETPCGKNNPDYYKGNVILLVNEKSISHSEFTAMTLKTAPKATVIGSQTAGSDGRSYRFEIIKGIWTSFTTYGVFYPDKKETQRIGIVPDIIMEPTILGIQQGRDEVLERAVLFANELQ